MWTCLFLNFIKVPFAVLSGEKLQTTKKVESNLHNELTLISPTFKLIRVFYIKNVSQDPENQSAPTVGLN